MWLYVEQIRRLESWSVAEKEIREPRRDKRFQESSLLDSDPCRLVHLLYRLDLLAAESLGWNSGRRLVVVGVGVE